MIYNLLADTTSNTSSVGTWIMLAVLAVLIIGMLVWSSISKKKQQKQTQDMMNGIRIGDRVKTIGGICGFIVEINDAENTIVVETGSETNKSYMKFDKGAIYQTAPPQGNCVPAPEEKEELKDGEKVEVAEGETHSQNSVAEVTETPVEEQVKKETPQEETAATESGKTDTTQK